MSEPKALSRPEDYFKTEARPVRELQPQKADRYPWLAILRAITPDTFREVSMSYDSCKDAINRLVKSGKIKRDEYFAARRTTPDGKRHVFIARRGKHSD